MTDGGATALEQALGLHKAPRRAASLRRQPLPPGIEQLLRIAAGDREAVATAAAASDETEAQVREAATFYVQQVLFDPEADSYRVLGLDPGASDAQIKANHRWLVHWLHPDRNRDSWEAVFADRVNAAWNDVRNPARRSSYALRTPSFVDAGDAAAPATMPAPATDIAPPEDEAPRLSPRIARRAPAIVIGLLAIVAVSVLGLLWQAQRDADADVARALASSVTPVEQPIDADTLARTDAAARVPVPVPAPIPAPPVAEVANGPASPLPTVAAPAAAVPSPSPVPALRDTSTAAAAAIPSPRESRIDPRPSPPAPAPLDPRMQTPLPTVAASEPVATTIPAPAPPAAARTNGVVVLHDPYAAATLDPAAAQALVQRYAERYERGDLPGLRALFTAAPDHALRKVLRELEQQVVRSDYRRIELRRHDLSPVGKGARLVSPYVATVVAVGAPEGTVSRGVLVMDVQLEDGQPRITALHQEIER